MREGNWAISRRTSARNSKYDCTWVGAVEGSKGINIKTRGLLERNRSAAMYIMYQDLNGLPKKIPYRQAKE